MSRVLVAIILFALTILIAIFLLWPQYLRLENSQAQIQNKETELKYKEDYYNELSSISEKLETEYSDSFKKIDSALPAGSSIPSLYNFLQKKASESGLILKNVGSFSVNPSTTITGLKEISLDSLGFSGSYPSFKNFLVALEKNSRIFEVENISFSTPKEGDEIFDFKLTIKTYSY
jgi:Tfp pilus assembly protein PilO